MVGLLHGGIYLFFNQSLDSNYFFEVYLGNFFFTLILLIGLLQAFNGFSHYVAWLYIIASGLKFGLFFLLLWPLYREDGDVNKLEKITFFIPYITGLFLETKFLISKLNKI